MSTTIMIISIVLFFLIIIGIVVVVLLKTKKELKLFLDKSSFSSGEIITGKITFKPKNAVTCNNVYIRIYGEKGQLARTESGGTETKWRILYEDERLIDGDKIFQPGIEKTITFELNAPSEESLGNVSLDSEIIGSAGDIQKIIKKPGRYKWTITALLECNGKNITDSKEFSLNLNSKDNKIM